MRRQSADQSADQADSDAEGACDLETDGCGVEDTDPVEVTDGEVQGPLLFDSTEVAGLNSSVSSNADQPLTGDMNTTVAEGTTAVDDVGDLGTALARMELGDLDLNEMD